MIIIGQLQKLQQINNLVIAPVTNTCPGIVGLGFLPVDTGSGDSIGVVTIRSGRVNKLADHRFNIVRNRDTKSFPVLEDIAPVALKIQQLRTIVLFHLNREFIPGSRRVAMAAAKRKWQVFHTQTLQAGIIC